MHPKWNCFRVDNEELALSCDEPRATFPAYRRADVRKEVTCRRWLFPLRIAQRIARFATGARRRTHIAVSTRCAVLTRDDSGSDFHL